MRLQPVTDGIAVINQSERDFLSPKHSHAQGQLIYAVKGVVEVVTDEGLWVVPPTRAIWVPPCVEHTTRSHGEVAFRALLIDPDKIEFFCPSQCMVVHVSPLLRELIVRLAEIAEADADQSERIEAIVRLLMMEMAFSPITAFMLAMPNEARLISLCETIRQTPSRTISIEHAALQSGMSRASFMRHFMAQTGLSFGRWQQQARLLAALALLAEGRAIIDVANACGYDSPSAFSAMFRRSLGRAPSEYFGVVR